MATTTRHQLPYPVAADPAVPHTDIKALAEKLDTKLDQIAPDQIVGPAAGQLLIANSSGEITGVAMSGDATITPAGEVTIGAGKVATNKVADKAVTTGKLDDGVITTPKIADGAVATAKIPDGAVTRPKLAIDTVTLDVTGAGGTIVLSGISYQKHIQATARVSDTGSGTPRVAVRNQGTQVWIDWANGVAGANFKIDVLAINKT